VTARGSRGQRRLMSSREPNAYRTTFQAQRPRVAWFSDVICRRLASTDEPLHVLDIGCGTGEQLFDLALRLPRARFVGVDIAPAYVTAAIQRQATHPAGDRLSFQAADYRSFRAPEPFDVVITYSVLQWISGGAELLAYRIAQDATGSGLFVNVMPYRCAYNDVLALVRRGLRAVRTRHLDELVLRTARALHEQSVDRDLIAERLEYAYTLPEVFEDDIASALGARGFQTEHRELAAHASAAQMKHALRVMRRA
jgi:trans-aconitate methyltransferase